MARATLSALTFTEIASGVKTGDPSAMTALYENIVRYYRPSALRHLRNDSDADDAIHDTYLAVVRAIRRGLLGKPEHLGAFTRTIFKRTIYARIAQIVEQRRVVSADVLDIDHRHAILDGISSGVAQQVVLLRAAIITHKDRPDVEFESLERRTIAAHCLGKLRPKDQDILRRFYFEGQSQADICKAMCYTETQFRLNKSRAKARLALLVSRCLKFGYLNTLSSLNKNAPASL